MAAFTSSAPQLASPDNDGLVGEVKIWPSETLPNGKWRYCDGALLSRANYSLLFARIGDAWGAGDGTTTFAVPNMSGKFPVGVDPADTDFDGVGDTGGTKTTNVVISGNVTGGTVSITGSTNSAPTSSADQNGDGSQGTFATSHTHTVTGSGSLSGATFSDTVNPASVPPYAVVRFIIKVI